MGEMTKTQLASVMMVFSCLFSLDVVLSHSITGNHTRIIDGDSKIQKCDDKHLIMTVTWKQCFDLEGLLDPCKQPEST